MSERSDGWLGWWALPWAVLLVAYAMAGWLDPQHWLKTEPPAMRIETAAARPHHGKTALRPPPPWPDENAIRQQLGWHGLQLQQWKLGPQRVGASEVRVQLQWQGALNDGMAMLHHLAREQPQMVIESLVLQARSAELWQFDWRGRWMQLLPPEGGTAPEPASMHVAWSSHPVLDVTWFEQHQRQWWGGQNPASAALRLMRPEQMQLVAIVLRPQPQAWVSWQQRTLVLKVGDRLGPQGAEVKSIDASGLQWGESGRVHRLRPIHQLWPVKE